jgi:hypothetical protein
MYISENLKAKAKNGTYSSQAKALHSPVFLILMYAIPAAQGGPRGGKK